MFSEDPQLSGLINRYATEIYRTLFTRCEISPMCNDHHSHCYHGLKLWTKDDDIRIFKKVHRQTILEHYRPLLCKLDIEHLEGSLLKYGCTDYKCHSRTRNYIEEH